MAHARLRRVREGGVEGRDHQADRIRDRPGRGRDAMTPKPSPTFLEALLHFLLGMQVFAGLVLVAFHALDIGEPELRSSMLGNLGLSLLVVSSLFVMVRVRARHRRDGTDSGSPVPRAQRDKRTRRGHPTNKRIRQQQDGDTQRIGGQDGDTQRISGSDSKARQDRDIHGQDRHGKDRGDKTGTPTMEDGHALLTASSGCPFRL